ncbi:asparagine synthase (glutamine-hydrolyzing) [Clostridium sp. AM58-1XD]|uniref:asparagine synthase (glutamine-hydrolyzing) n=1 Tax=Clostridium sp. AM58-1XD TaxID=2292307 RepID=UPI000E50F96F|nr:asparagine synthase (glutamine-hydrolyzing) [Clostridium sp. AM58-1XD]RGY99684.1 asparagine synthase (glutamine-hydrolyzing) [Clostridium sp. AM58-1XD]
MSGIAGFYHPSKDYMDREEYYQNQLDHFNRVLKRRGPDDSGTFLSSHCGLSRTWLAVNDTKTGHQPVQMKKGDRTLTLVCDGELYNKKELVQDLVSKGFTELASGSFPPSDGEVLLAGFFEYGPDFIEQVNGPFAIALYDSTASSVRLFRDRSGIKPLFYSYQDGELVFASEIKGLFSFPNIRPQLDKTGLNEVFSLGPARTYGSGIFCGIREVLPAHFLSCSSDGLNETCYWTLSSHPHEDDYETTVAKTSQLVQDAILRQMESDVPICTFLSGGVDSSLVSAVCARELKKHNRRLTTYSFDFADSEKYFHATAFQPSLDKPFVEKMVSFLDSDHHYLECTTRNQADALYDSIKAHDLPNMADVDSSMLYFCSLVGHDSHVVLTGECADEIFGGYPWFHKEECLSADTFPWTMDLDARKVLLKDEFTDYLGMEDYVAEAYHKSVAETPAWEGDSPEEKKRRKIAYLNLKWFMQTLLNRMDRDGSYSALAARVPFADYRIIEYLWNVPWDMKASGGVVKGLLREAGSGLLPEEILWRRKSPYPKTYDTGYESLIASRVREMMADSASPVLPFLDKKKVEKFLESPSDYGKPWYGQLMAAPQMMAYILQINYWLKEYGIRLIL